MVPTRKMSIPRRAAGGDRDVSSFDAWRTSTSARVAAPTQRKQESSPSRTSAAEVASSRIGLGRALQVAHVAGARDDQKAACEMAGANSRATLSGDRRASSPHMRRVGTVMPATRPAGRRQRLRPARRVRFYPPRSSGCHPLAIGPASRESRHTAEEVRHARPGSLVTCAVVVVMALAGPVAPADAAVTIGSDLTRSPDSDASCEVSSTCLAVQTALPGNAQPLVAPAGGVIVRWRVKTLPGTVGSVKLVILPPATNGAFTHAGIVQTVTPANSGGIQVFAPLTGAAIQADDAIGRR